MKSIILADSSHGIYISQYFYESINWDRVSCVTDQQKEDISDPENEYYWDAWDLILNNAVLHDDEGDALYLYLTENGDLLAVDLEWLEACNNDD